MRSSPLVLSRRTTAMLAVIGCLLFFLAIFLGAWLYGEHGHMTRLSLRKLPPGWGHPFGTDWLGRDMFARTLQGLCFSLGIGLSAAFCSSLVALSLGLAAATLGKTVDTLITWLVDLAMSTPHLVLLILISFACGGGAKGIIIAVAASHWPAMTRVIRAEVMQLGTSDFVKLSRKLGKRPAWIARYHLLPHIVPQFLVGLLLLFPHAILHAAGLSFLGFGMSPHIPEIGTLLSESMRHLSTGMWWLAVAPGLSLVLAVMAFDLLGNTLKALLDPKTMRE